MNRRALLVPLALAWAATAAAQTEPPPRIAYGNPSAGIAADIAFARLAKAKGRWAAFRETSAPDAVMFVPQMVLAQPWLKDRPEPPKPLAWQPSAAWASCDGSLVVTSGAWQSGEASGWYTTVWRRQDKDGGYKWVFDHGGPLAQPAKPSDMIEARVAECPPRPKPPAGAPLPDPRKRGKPAKPQPIVFDPAKRAGSSRDGSLTWAVAADPSGAHHFVASLRVNGQMTTFRDEKVDAEVK